MSQLDWLALLVCTLYLLLGAAPAFRSWPVLAAMGLFVPVTLGLRWHRIPLRPPALRTVLRALATIVLISAVATRTGGPVSPLVNLYLLPLLMVAVTPGLGGTLVAVLAVCAAWLALLAGHDATPGATPILLVGIVGQLGPFALVAYLTRRLATAALRARRQLAESAERDPLTGLVNRRSFEELLQREHARRQQGGAGYALLLVNIDALGQVNETAGYDAGNAAIRSVAESIKRTIRDTDLAARLGGDEFVVLLPGAPPEGAKVVAQRIRNAVFTSLFQSGNRMQRMTVSVGAGTYPQDGRTAEEALAAAGRRMQQDRSLRRKPGDAEPPSPSRL
jgi:diguanylate cyclase (GGDEF)-like protein